MSENKKEKKLPGKDYYRKGKTGDKEKAVTKKVTEEEKAEFAEVFEEKEEVKT